MSVVIRKDTTGLDDFRRRMGHLNGIRLTIGFQGRRAMVLYPNGINVASVAAIHEFGKGRNPQRSFMRSTMFEQRDAISNIIAKRVGRYLRGKDGSLDALVSSMSKAAKAIMDMIGDKIRTAASWAIRNSDSTIARKGMNRPLIDTTKMLNNLSWAVRGPNGAILATNSTTAGKR